MIDATMPINANGDALVDALLNICEEAAEAVQGEYGHGGGAKVIILSDKMAGPDRLPIPSLLAAGAVHQHLIKTKQRPKAALFIEAGKLVTYHVQG